MYPYCIFWPVFGCCALQTLVQMCFFTFFAWQIQKRNIKKQKCVCGACTQMQVKGSFSLKNYSTSVSPKNAFASFCLLFVCFYLFHAKLAKKHGLTSILSAQHPNAGQNIQIIQTLAPKCLKSLTTWLAIKCCPSGLKVLPYMKLPFDTIPTHP